MLFQFNSYFYIRDNENKNKLKLTKMAKINKTEVLESLIAQGLQIGSVLEFTNIYGTSSGSRRVESITESFLFYKGGQRESPNTIKGLIKKGLCKIVNY